jgi:hypothetical protein
LRHFFEFRKADQRDGSSFIRADHMPFSFSVRQSLPLLYDFPLSF